MIRRAIGIFCNIIFVVLFPFVALAVYPTIAFIRGPVRRWRRRRKGLCLTCGYDLRGTPERCPECGRETDATG